jgi:hypothetical protein
MDYKFPPKPASKHLELQRPATPEGQLPEPAPPITHAGPYKDIAGLRKTRTMTTSQTPPISPQKDVASALASPERKGVRFPWEKKDPRPQDGIASGLATTLGFGAAGAPADAVAHFKPSEEYEPRQSSEKQP